MTVENIDPPDAAEAHRLLTEEVASLRQQLADARTNSDTTAAELSELKTQLAAAQRELERLRTPAPPPAPAATRKRVDGFFEVEETEP